MTLSRLSVLSHSSTLLLPPRWPPWLSGNRFGPELIPPAKCSPQLGGSACSPPPASAKKEEEEEESSALSFLSIFIFIYMHTDTHTRDDFLISGTRSRSQLASNFWQTQRFGDQEGPQPNLSPTKLAELPSSCCPQGTGIAPSPGMAGDKPPELSPWSPGLFSDVGKVQIEPCPFPLLQSIPHLCTCTSPQNLVWGVTVPPKKAVPKSSVGQDPPITDLLCQEQWHRLGSLVNYDAKKNCFKYQRKQNKWPKVGLSSPHSPFPNGNTKKEENPEQSAVWIRESKQERKEEHSHSSLKVTLCAPCSSSPTC